MVVRHSNKWKVHRVRFCDPNDIIDSCIANQVEFQDIRKNGTKILIQFRKLNDKQVHSLPENENKIGFSVENVFLERHTPLVNNLVSI